ncbi:unnamed protein product [Merluccius merluccius]
MRWGGGEGSGAVDRTVQPAALRCWIHYRRRRSGPPARSGDADASGIIVRYEISEIVSDGSAPTGCAHHAPYAARITSDRRTASRITPHRRTHHAARITPHHLTHHGPTAARITPHRHMHHAPPPHASRPTAARITPHRHMHLAPPPHASRPHRRTQPFPAGTATNPSSAVPGAVFQSDRILPLRPVIRIGSP